MIVGNAELQPHPSGHPAAMEFLLQAAAGEEAAALAWQHAAEAWQRQSALLCKAADPEGEGQGDTPVIEIDDTLSPTEAKEEQEEEEQEPLQKWEDGPEEEPPTASSLGLRLQKALGSCSSGATMPQRPNVKRTPPKLHPRPPIGVPPAALLQHSVQTMPTRPPQPIAETSGKRGASRMHATSNCQGGKGASQPYTRSDAPKPAIGARFNDTGK